MKTYRDIFRWGDPAHDEVLDTHIIKLLKEYLNLGEQDISEKYLTGSDPVQLKKKCRLSASFLNSLIKIAGEKNVAIEDTERASHAYGKSCHDILRLKLGIINNPPDAVVYPRNENDIVKILQLCRKNKTAVTPFGGHSSVTGGVETPRGGISLDLTRHMNKVIEVNETNSSATIQPGIYGPALEKDLNEYGKGYTCGHFPQSFEYSTLGGWIAARSAGQASTGYGKIEDIVLSLRMVTPSGIIQTKAFPRAAMGPDLNQILIGSEGTYGIITEACIKIRKNMPENTRMISFLFKDFESGLKTMKEVMQGRFGFPFVFRLTDPEETDISFKLKGMNNTLADRFLKMLGYKSPGRCLFLATVEGDKSYVNSIVKNIKKTAAKNRSLGLGAGPVRKWFKQRYSSAYLRDPLMDIGLITDTLETAVTWENLPALWYAVREYIKKRPDSICMSHISHAYENGANLYFTFISPVKKGKEINDYKKFQKGIIDTIVKNKGSISHHHGIGKDFAPWMENLIEPPGMGIMRSVKEYLDPGDILNPGGTLGLKK
ncbi:MAG: FAD-binding oxidoreductase [Spirochaetes bacterium]|nr:FAD-binding oxidoreductase [Spirochaetota bacterium]